jgi:Pyruvate/2-oxoacid:ferredoxin oxidoreductase delta subunit
MARKKEKKSMKPEGRQTPPKKPGAGNGSGRTDDIYERLADALDALPSGFPRTKSGVEMKLIKMAFAPEEVALAGQLTRFPETAAEIAKRVGMDEADVTVLCESLIPRRLVRLDSPGYDMAGQDQGDGAKKYRLGMFLVGWYEANMRLLGKEFAELFEQYVIEGGGEKILAPRPGVLGVVPVRGSLSPEQIKVMEPHLDIDAHFKRHERFVVFGCVCKREQELLHGHSCDMPMKRCGFVGVPPQTPLSENVLDREEADKLLRELEDMGHVHLAAYGYVMGAEKPQFVGGCNCCGCCCGVLHGQKLAGLSEGAQRSNYRAVIDPEECISCGACQERCPVDAITDDENDKSKVDRAKCIGCGVCVIKCPTDAIELEPVSAQEWFHTPSSMAEWEERRLEYLASQK